MSDYDITTDDLLKDVVEILPLGLLDESLIPAEWANDFIPFHPEPSDPVNVVDDSEETGSLSGGGAVPYALQEHSTSILNDVYITAPISFGADSGNENEHETTMIDISNSLSLPEILIDSCEENLQMQMMPSMNMHNSASAGHVSGNSDNDSLTDARPIDLTASAATAALVQAPLEATLEYTPPKPNRKRNSNSESSSTSSQNAATKSKGGSKKTKMYENPDKSDPLVVRAEYAKTYRERKKEEKANLSNQLQNVEDDLRRSKDKNKQLERTTSEQNKQINSLKLEIKLKDEKIAELEDILKNEKDKNSLNPSQTREMVENFASVVDNFRSRGSRPMKLIVPERLGKKKAYALTHEEVQSICDNASMERSCTINFDLDEDKKVGKPLNILHDMYFELFQNKIIYRTQILIHILFFFI